MPRLQLVRRFGRCQTRSTLRPSDQNNGRFLPSMALDLTNDLADFCGVPSPAGNLRQVGGAHIADLDTRQIAI